MTPQAEELRELAARLDERSAANAKEAERWDEHGATHSAAAFETLALEDHTAATALRAAAEDREKLERLEGAAKIAKNRYRRPKKVTVNGIAIPSDQSEDRYCSGYQDAATHILESIQPRVLEGSSRDE